MRPSAVVMAAGRGVRLRPLTERWAKPVLPIDGRPVIATLLRELASAGIEDVTVVTGHLAEQVEELVGDGTAFGLPVRIVRQPKPVGSADAVRRAVDAGVQPPLLVTAADTVFAQGDLANVVERWERSRAAGAVGVRRGRRPHQTPVHVRDDHVVEFGGNEGGRPLIHPRPAGAGGESSTPEHSAAPLWFLGEQIAGALADVPGPPFELAHAVRDAIAAGKEILAFEMRPTRDLTQPADVVAHNFPYLSREDL